MSNSNKEDLLESLNAIIKATKQQLQEASHIIITYGTAWIYRNIESDSIVANCHKVPQKKFTKELLSIAEIEKSLEQITTEIQILNPNCHFIFTVSPVRHIKDGFVENQQSKAHLISAIHSSIFRLPTSSYFPSYEIMMDELRDYRFYAPDMLHPSQVAVNYIWERFSETNISEESHSIMQEVETIQRGLAHRAFNPNSQSHQDFLLQLNQKIIQFEEKYYPIQFC